MGTRDDNGRPGQKGSAGNTNAQAKPTYKPVGPTSAGNSKTMKKPAGTSKKTPNKPAALGQGNQEKGKFKMTMPKGKK